MTFGTMVYSQTQYNNLPLTRDILSKESSKSLFVNPDINFFLGCLSFKSSAFEAREYVAQKLFLAEC